MTSWTLKACIISTAARFHQCICHLCHQPSWNVLLVAASCAFHSYWDIIIAMAHLPYPLIGHEWIFVFCLIRFWAAGSRWCHDVFWFFSVFHLVFLPCMGYSWRWAAWWLHTCTWWGPFRMWGSSTCGIWISPLPSSWISFSVTLSSAFSLSAFRRFHRCGQGILNMHWSSIRTVLSSWSSCQGSGWSPSWWTFPHRPLRCGSRRLCGRYSAMLLNRKFSQYSNRKLFQPFFDGIFVFPDWWPHIISTWLMMDLQEHGQNNYAGFPTFLFCPFRSYIKENQTQGLVLSF